MKNNFEEFIKQSVNDVEVEYNPNHWTKVEQAMNKREWGAKYYITGAILVGAIISASVILWPSDTQQKPQSVEHTKKIKPVTTDLKTAEISLEKTDTKEIKSTPVEPITPLATNRISAPSTTPALIQHSNPKNNASESKIVTKKSAEGSLIGSIKMSRSIGCSDEAFYFSAESNVPVNYDWNFGDGEHSSLPNPAHAYAKPGKYSVSLKLTSILDGNTLVIADGNNLIVHQKPVAKLNYVVDEDNNFSRAVEFSNLTRNHIGSQWIFNGKYYNEEAPRILVSHKGSYTVTLIVKNDHGCYDTLSQQIVLDKDYNLLAPTAFTPNDDNQNDDFLPMAWRRSDVAFTMEIIEPRSGKVIFSSNKNAWDGINLTTGRKADPGTYLWIVNLNRPDNTKEIFKGNVTLLNR